MVTVGEWKGKANHLQLAREGKVWVPPLASGFGIGRKRMRRGLTVQHGLAGQ